MAPPIKIKEMEVAQVFISLVHTNTPNFFHLGTSSSGLKRVVKKDNLPKDIVPNIKTKVKTSIQDVLLAIHKEKRERRKSL